MPTYNGINIELLTATKAEKRGYITGEARQRQWQYERAKFGKTDIMKFVYADGEYKGMTRPKEKVFETIERLILKK